MANFQNTLIKYEKEFKRLDIAYDRQLLINVTKACGPSIYQVDASRIAASNKEEMGRVKTNFLIQKLGLEDSPELDQAIEEVAVMLEKQNKHKYRAMFYYLLVIKLDKSDVFNTTQIEKADGNDNTIQLLTYFDKITSEDAGLLKRLAQ